MRILAIHQGGELYGSDRSFVQCLRAFRRAWPEAEIHVRLAGHGPLEALISPIADSCTVTDLLIARRSDALLRLPFALLGLIWRLPRILSEMRRYDLVYVNTVVILDHLLASLVCGRRTLIHVREITPPSRLGRLLRMAVRHSRGARLFNSAATARAYGLLGDGRSAVVWNGVEGPDSAIPPQAGDVVRIALIGRISDGKGQDLAVEAIALLPEATRARLHLRIVGSAFQGQEHVEAALAAQIARQGLGAQVTLVPFHPDVAAEYRGADIVLVPSRRPESFGRVAIEAMAHARPVIVADHGGLSEIVEPDRSGLKVRPNDAAALAGAIARLIAAPEEIGRLGAGARARYEAMFTARAMESALIGAVRDLVRGID